MQVEIPVRVIKGWRNANIDYIYDMAVKSDTALFGVEGLAPSRNKGLENERHKRSYYANLAASRERKKQSMRRSRAKAKAEREAIRNRALNHEH